MRERLPIDAVLGGVVESLQRHASLVLRAPPGAGKTTRVPAALLDAGLVPAGHRVLMLEPRRVAARAAARRIAFERDGRVGEEVGYQIRFEDRTSARTRIAILTEGLLTRRLESDPTLEGVAAVVLDEFHERSIHADLALAFLKEIQENVRPDLRIVVMSATLEAEPIAAYLGGCPVIESAGRAHPVDLRWLDRPDAPTSAELVGPGGGRAQTELVVSGVRRALRADQGDDGGDVLVFLPGAGEIRRAIAALEPLGLDLDLVPLYGDLDGAAQDRALERGPRRRVVLATNIAETSVTVGGVTTVVDLGLAKIQRHDPSRGVDRLDIVRISRPSADQRAGRAGRTRPGRAFRLWTRHEDARLPARDVPEVARIDLAPAVLEIAAWSGRDPAAFAWLDPPPAAALASAIELLLRLGAIERTQGSEEPRASGQLKVTRLGQTLRRFPLHPRVASLLVAAHRLGVLEEGALVAALASERDIVRRADASRLASSGPSDLLLRAELFEARASHVDGDAARAVGRARGHLLDIASRVLGRSKGPRGGDEAVMRAVLAGFPDRVGRRRAPGSDRVLLVGGRGARIDDSSVVRGAPLLVAIDLEDPRRDRESLIRVASAIEEEWLAEDTGGVHEVKRVRWNAEREAAEGVVERRYEDLVLRERPDPKADPEALSAVLAEAAEKDRERVLVIDGAAAELLARLRFLRGAMPELHLADLAGDDLRSFLLGMCAGRRSFEDLRRVDLAEALEAHLGHATRAQLDRHAPERIAVPSGSKIKLRYEGDGPPALAVRLQEVFGLVDSPRVAGGRVAVKMELLSPAMRPVQVTQDLRSFWDTTYQEVRRELRARYPKHQWPEDPYEGVPERRPRRKRPP